MTDYCGFDGWPDCATLATTGSDPTFLLGVAVIAILAIIIGIAATRRKK